MACEPEHTDVLSRAMMTDHWRDELWLDDGDQTRPD